MATSILLATTWPTKLETWTPHLYETSDGSAVDFDAIRAGLDECTAGPWDGCSGGERRALDLACLVADRGALAEALSGADTGVLFAFLKGMTSAVSAQLDEIKQLVERYGINGIEVGS